MEKLTICTIITGNHGHYALALYDSIREFSSEAYFAILVTKGNLNQRIQVEIEKKENIFLFSPDDFEGINLASQIQEKYFNVYHDAYRWGMKPVFLKYLLDKDFKKVIYLDSDIFFFSGFNFLWKKLDVYKILLSPHWRSSDPKRDVKNFELNFLDGIYNGGFIGASKGAEEALNYWAQLCLHNCTVKRSQGYYVDQRYLDILPTRFEGVSHIEHKGCNIANWNQIDCQRTLRKNGEVLINNKYPIIFIHFTNTMLKGIYFENDTLLLPYLEKYRNNLLKYSEVDIIEDFHKKGKFKKSRSEEDFKPQDKIKSKNKFQEIKRIIKKIYRKLK